MHCNFPPNTLSLFHQKYFKKRTNYEASRYVDFSQIPVASSPLNPAQNPLDCNASELQSKHICFQALPRYLLF
jgi:hypothetical protein